MNLCAEEKEDECQTRISDQSIILSNIANELLAEDAGAALLQAALRCWEQHYGRGGALILARTALMGVNDELEQRLAPAAERTRYSAAPSAEA